MPQQPPPRPPGSRLGFGKVLIPALEEATSPEAPIPRRRLADAFPPGTPQHPTRPQQRTQTGMPAPPAPESAPQPLRTPKGMAPGPSSMPPRIDSPPPISVPTSQAERELAETRAELQDARELLSRLATAAEEASSRRTLASAELPWWKSTGGLLKVMAAAPVALAAATGSLVLIINALRAPTDPQLRADVDAIKVEVRGLRTYLQQKDQARAEELEKRFDAIGARLVELDLRYPAPKKHPDAPPN